MNALYVAAWAAMIVALAVMLSPLILLALA
jgi:hypothetical protein